MTHEPQDQPHIRATSGVHVWRHMVVDGQSFTVRTRPGEPGTYDFRWENGPIEGYGFTIGTSSGGPLDEDVLREEIRSFVAGYEP